MNELDIIQGLLYSVGDEGIDETVLSELTSFTPHQLNQCILEYQSEVFEIQKYGSKYFLALKPEMHPYIEQLVTKSSEKRLTQASMETLSIIAYNQPVTRSDIETMRGINSDGPVRTLLEKGLISSETSEARSHQLYTTDYFLQVFGLQSLDELPAISENEMQEEMDLFFKSMNEKGGS